MGVVARPARRAAVLGLAVLAVTVAVVLYCSDRNLELYGGGRGLAQPVDAVIVLGAGIDPDGVIGYSTRRRLEAGAALLAAGKTDRLILAGGTAQHGEHGPIGAAMRAYAEDLGAPPEALLVEGRSVSTFENLRFSFALAEARGLERLAVLTDAYHLERTRLLAAYFGHPQIGLIAAGGLDRETLPARVIATLREALAWWYNLAKVAGWEILAAVGASPETREAWIR